jgi:NAD(P)-dependent dehydrogenase (short-subunit alcohol dehydrogenase family)
MSPRAYVVTGGTGALGQALVVRLLREGHRVAVPFHTAPPWSDLRAAAGMSEALWGEPADMSDPAAAGHFMAAAVAWLGRLDGVAALVGGYAGSGPLELAPASEWDEMLKTNLASAYATCRAALPHLVAAGGGAIVLVSSQLVRSGGAGAAAYTVAKAGVEALTRALALENRGRHVRVNAVAPAIIDTPENRKALPKADQARFTPPDEIAAVITSLLAGALPVSGAVIPVDDRA